MNIDCDQTHFFLVRHGETRANAQSYIGGSTDDPLTQRGHQQARMVAEHLRLAATPVTAVYSSPLKRARETAAHISGALKITSMTVDALAEWHVGDWERMPYSQIPHQRNFRRELLFDPTWSPPGGETLGSVQQRVVTTLKEIGGRHKGEKVVVVSHGTALALSLAELIDNQMKSWTQYKLKNCSICELLLGGQPRLLAANQVDHLHRDDGSVALPGDGR